VIRPQRQAVDSVSVFETFFDRKRMRKINTKDIAEFSWSSPKGKFFGSGLEILEALGRKPSSTDLRERHPFDVEICRIPPGKSPYPYHSTALNGSFIM
jgi:hypothetical protein